jgi:hypothetical protein
MDCRIEGCEDIPRPNAGATFSVRLNRAAKNKNIRKARRSPPHPDAPTPIAARGAANWVLRGADPRMSRTVP